jgi:O-antigen/teichoic acid export membrane protein
LTGSIGLPALSEVYRRSPERMAEVLHKFRKRVIAASLILAAITVFIGDPLIKLLYDQRYHSAGHFVSILTLSNSISIIFSAYFSALLTMNESKSGLIFNITLTFLRISGSIFGFYNSGISGMIVGVGIANILLLIIFWIYFKFKLNIQILFDIFSLCVIFLLYILSLHISPSSP